MTCDRLLSLVLAAAAACGGKMPHTPERVSAHQSPCVPATTAALRGCVRDQWTGAAIAGAIVVVTTPAGATLATTITDEAGEWGVDLADQPVTVTVYAGGATVPRALDTIAKPVLIVLDPQPGGGELI